MGRDNAYMHYVVGTSSTVFSNRVPQVTERPYVTEAGPEVFDLLYKTYMHQLLLLQQHLALPTLRRITMASLVKDIHHLLIGVPSETFMFDLTSEAFRITPGTCLSGLSPESLASACAELMECGSFYWRLAKFSEPPVMDSFYKAGLVFQVKHA